MDLAIKGALTSQFQITKKQLITMEPTETSLQMGQNELSLLSQSFVPNFIRTTDDNEQSYEPTGQQQ